MAKKKDNVTTGMEYMLHMKEYLGQDKMEDYINTRFAHFPDGTRKKAIHIVNRMHEVKHRKTQLEMPLV